MHLPPPASILPTCILDYQSHCHFFEPYHAWSRHEQQTMSGRYFQQEEVEHDCTGRLHDTKSLGGPKPLQAHQYKFPPNSFSPNDQAGRSRRTKSQREFCLRKSEPKLCWNNIFWVAFSEAESSFETLVSLTALSGEKHAFTLKIITNIQGNHRSVSSLLRIRASWCVWLCRPDLPPELPFAKVHIKHT